MAFAVGQRKHPALLACLRIQRVDRAAIAGDVQRIAIERRIAIESDLQH